MLRINLILFLTVVTLALGIVTAQYKARKLYDAMDQQLELTKRYRTEYDQLQIEQSTWAMHSRLESIATTTLRMHVPTLQQTRVVTLDAGSTAQVKP